VLGFSAITNMATGGVDQEPDLIEDVHRVADIAGKKLRTALAALLPELLPKGDSTENHGGRT
jgi:hypothetical protein